MFRTTVFISSLIVFGLAVVLGLAPAQDSLRSLYERPQAEWPEPHLDPGVEHREIGPLPEVVHPDTNPYNRAKAQLGKILFFDPRMSASGHVACANCHDPELGWSNGRSTAFGHLRREGSRNSPSIINAGYWEEFFWDGRAHSLEHQATFPIADHLEMATQLKGVDERIAGIEGYGPLFEAAFGDREISLATIMKAIATFERTVVSRTSRFDQFVEGRHQRMTDQEILGLHLFRTKARCLNCHNGPLFSDQEYHNLGQSRFGLRGEDLGRYNVTKDTADLGAFRTPSLRDVAYTGPWLHAGNVRHLDEIIRMYNRGMFQPGAKKHADDPFFPKLDPLLQPLHLTKSEQAALVAFLEAISTEPYIIRVPNLPQ